MKNLKKTDIFLYIFFIKKEENRNSEMLYTSKQYYKNKLEQINKLRAKQIKNILLPLFKNNF